MLNGGFAVPMRGEVCFQRRVTLTDRRARH
jgi:hypothetical protein